MLHDVKLWSIRSWQSQSKTQSDSEPRMIELAKSETYDGVGRSGDGDISWGLKLECPDAKAGAVVLPSFRDLLLQIGEVPEPVNPASSTRVRGRKAAGAQPSSPGGKSRGHNPVRDRRRRFSRNVEGKRKNPHRESMKKRVCTEPAAIRICSTCHKQVHKCSLLRHQRTHLNTIFPCNICEETFTRQDNLERHCKSIHDKGPARPRTRGKKL
ncbi:hypothetical protein DENSPDRAFT_619797 [Dentipellis sp. KUC8613]|nr:hypothetical protein DENSPDRAFT_619797 [Dentipellis sp. KUC8613]